MNAPSSSRKRSRSSTPTSNKAAAMAAAAATPIQRRVESSEDVMRAAQLRNPSTRIPALNALLKLTLSHETNYALTGDSVLNALVEIALECVQWRENNEEDEDDEELEEKNGNKDNGDDEEQEENDNDIEEDDKPVFSSADAWMQSPTRRNDTWAQHWREQLGSNRLSLAPQAVKTLEVVVMIFRNMSFVGANHRMFAYTPAVLEILMGCMYDGYDTAITSTAEESSSSTNINNKDNSSSSSSSAPSPGLAVAAMQTLLHLVPMLDLSGQKLLCDKLFYLPHASKDGPLLPNADGFGQTVGGGWGFGGMWLAKRLDTKEDVMSHVTKGFLLSFTADYLTAVWSIFPALSHILTNPATPRAVLLMAVDLLQELVNQARVGVVGNVMLEDDPDEIPTLRAVLVKMPDALITRLIDFLYVPRLGPDALEYVSPMNNIVTRVTTYKLLMGYDATVDTDIRDRTLDLLVPLLELDFPRVAARLGSQAGSSSNSSTNSKYHNGMVRARLWDALVPILTTTAGRSEAPHLATQVLKELAKAVENRPGLLYIQEKMLKLACKHERVAHTVCHFWQLLPKDEDAEEANGEEDDDQGDDEEEVDDENAEESEEQEEGSEEGNGQE